jgi:hypothetical protein
MPLMAEVAAGRGEVLTRNATSETGASTAEMGAAKAADTSATTKPADMSAAAKAADMSAAAKAADTSAAAKAADMSAAAEPAAHVTATAETPTVSTPTTSAAARKRISGQSGAKRGSRHQDDHGLT